MEKSPSWSRAHDWKSCRLLKGLEGSNPSFSAKRNPGIATVPGFCHAPLPLTLTLIGFFNDLPKAAHPGTCWISCSIRSADCWRIFWDILVQTYG